MTNKGLTICIIQTLDQSLMCYFYFIVQTKTSLEFRGFLYIYCLKLFLLLDRRTKQVVHVLNCLESTNHVEKMLYKILENNHVLTFYDLLTVKHYKIVKSCQTWNIRITCFSLESQNHMQKINPSLHLNFMNGNWLSFHQTRILKKKKTETPLCLCPMHYHTGQKNWDPGSWETFWKSLNWGKFPE